MVFDFWGYAFCLLSCASQAAYLLLVEFQVRAAGFHVLRSYSFVPADLARASLALFWSRVVQLSAVLCLEEGIQAQLGNSTLALLPLSPSLSPNEGQGCSRAVTSCETHVQSHLTSTTQLLRRYTRLPACKECFGSAKALARNGCVFCYIVTVKQQI